MVGVGYCVGVVADETVDTLPDWRVLLARIVAIEERLDAIEGGATVRKSRTVAEPLEVVQAKPVLEVASSGMVRALSAVLGTTCKAAGDVGVEVKRVNFSSRIPAFRWTTSDGKTQTQTGYTRGTLQALLTRVTEGKP
jgi:hypothetical protein